MHHPMSFLKCPPNRWTSHFQLIFRLLWVLQLQYIFVVCFCNQACCAYLWSSLLPTNVAFLCLLLVVRSCDRIPLYRAAAPVLRSHASVPFPASRPCIPVRYSPCASVAQSVPSHIICCSIVPIICIVPLSRPPYPLLVSMICPRAPYYGPLFRSYPVRLLLSLIPISHPVLYHLPNPGPHQIPTHRHSVSTPNAIPL